LKFIVNRIIWDLSASFVSLSLNKTINFRVKTPRHTTR